MKMNPTLEAERHYRTRLVVVMAAYVIVLFATIALTRHFAVPAPLRALSMLAPLVPIAFMVQIFVQYFRDTDELERQVLTDSLALAAGITAILSVTYGFLELAGLPYLSAWWTWIVLMGSWGLARCFLSGRYR